jgi:hypothetical protein
MCENMAGEYVQLTKLKSGARVEMLRSGLPGWGGGGMATFLYARSHNSKQNTRCFPIQKNCVFKKIVKISTNEVTKCRLKFFGTFSMLQILYRTVIRKYKKRFLPPSLPGSECEGDGGQCAACTRTTISPLSLLVLFRYQIIS